MDRQEFREKLQKEFESELHEHIQQYVDDRFEIYGQLLRYLSALDRKYEGDTLVKQGFSGIFKNIEDTLQKNNEKNLWDVYLSVTGRVASKFPEQVSWAQLEDRFEVDDQDSMFTAAGKRGKQVLQGISHSWHKSKQTVKNLFGGEKTPLPKWSQQIPLRNAITFYLVDDDFILDCMHTIERLQLDIINDIEELLVTEADDLDLAGFVSSKKKKLAEQKRELLDNINEAFLENRQQIVKDIEKIGTIEQSRGFFNKKRLASTKNKLVAHNQPIEKWQQIQRLFLERTRDVVQFLNLWADIRDETQSFRNELDEIFQDTVTLPLVKLEELLQQAVNNIDEESSPAEIKELNNSLVSFINDRLTEPIKKVLDKRILADKTEHFFEDLLLRVGQSPEKAQLVFAITLDKNPPTVDQKEVEWQQLVIRALRELLMSPLQPSEQHYEEFLADILEEVVEIENIISVNLDSALEANDEELEEAEDQGSVVTEALQRLVSKVQELNEQVNEKWDRIDTNIEEGSEKFYSSLLALLHKGDSQQMQLLNAKYTVKEKASDWHTVLDSKWARVQDKSMLWLRFAGKKMRKYGTGISDLLGFTDTELQESKRTDIATYLSETDNKMKQLPYIYRRLFDFRSLADRRFFEPAQESVMTFKKAYEQWQQGMPANFAIVGEKGSGKSSLLNLMIESELETEEVRVIEFDQTIWKEKHLIQKFSEVLNMDGAESIDDLIVEIRNSESSFVMCLESVQNCFVRNIRGFEAIEKLTYLITETRDSIFWVISCSRYAWTFLNKTVQLAEYFSHISKSDSLNADQIEKVILNRHKASGYAFYFEPDDQILQSRTFRKLKDDENEAQKYLKKEYFEKLTNLAEGNPSIAIIFWIRSIRDFDETSFYIQPIEITSVEMVQDLNAQIMFTLAAFVLHDTLVDKELAMIMNTTIEESRLLMNILRSRGMLVEKGNSYTINHLMYRQIVRVLKERNIIHLV